MENEFEVSLTGTDGSVEGVVTPVIYDGYAKAYNFLSLDGSLHLVIAENNAGHWTRLGGTEPYLSGWTDELAEQIVKLG